MKKQLLLLSGSLLLFSMASIAQDKRPLPHTKEYADMKAQGKFSIKHGTYNAATTQQKAVTPNMQVLTGNSGCNCLIPLDSSFQPVQFSGYLPPNYINDDGYTTAIPLPFNFCFYGQQVDSIYINNNGNISFTAPYSVFTSDSFPSANYNMIAPFWGDVDTRGAGLVSYKITPTALIIKWDSVGYYNSYIDKRNTFQLVITDGNDSLVPDGNNVAFCYGDMSWTTGDASMGVNGYGGVPATVGVNQGNGVNYFQVGRFDQAGNGYDGSYAANDSVDFLDYKYIKFNVCDTGNIPPLALSDMCDTIQMYVGQTNTYELSFLAPEINQLTTVNANGGNGFTLLNNASSNSAQVSFQFVASNTNLGYNVISFTATDNGTYKMGQNNSVMSKSVTYNKVIEVLGTTSVEQMNTSETLTLFPNPTNNSFNVKVNNVEKGILSVTNMLGETIYQQQISVGNTTSVVAINLENAIRGIYLVSLTSAKGRTVKKLVKE